MSDREAEGTHRQCVVHLTTTGKGCSLLPGAGGREARYLCQTFLLFNHLRVRDLRMSAPVTHWPRAVAGVC